MSAIYAIPGEAGRPKGPPPAGEIDRALAALSALGLRYQQRSFAGFLAPPLTARRATGAGGETIIQTVVMPELMARAATARIIDWSWRVLRERDDWFDAGWLPDAGWLALNDDVQDDLGVALNQRHLMHWTPARRPIKEGRT